MNRAVPSAPRDTAEGRALLQARLGQFGRVGALICAGFLLVDVVMWLWFKLAGSAWIMPAHLACVLVGGGTWLITRGRELAERTLIAIDLLATTIMSAAFVAWSFSLPLWARPEFVQLISVSDVLVLRAVLIPSSPTRTALLGVLGTLGVVISTFVLYRGHKIHPDAPPLAAFLMVAGTLSSGMLILTTLTSRTIFGLRERVREAMKLGQYTLLRKMGEGGMGVVYEARHAMLRRRTAIKLLRPERAGEHNLLRFEREVQLTSSLAHPNTVAIYDYGRSADGILYYAMEYLDGIDLETLLEVDGAQPPARVVHVLHQVCGALQEAHGVGLIHRDVKPANILLCTRGGQYDVAKVVDFGLVKSVSGGEDAAQSAVNQIVGTPLYMAPEAIVDPASVDARSDLYALGALAYALLAGRPPFSGASVVEVCGHHLHSTPPALRTLVPELSQELERTIGSCLAKSPGERPSSAAALAEMLSRCAESNAWSTALAESWWTSHALEVSRKKAQGALPSPSPVSETVAVDLRERAEQRRGD